MTFVENSDCSYNTVSKVFIALRNKGVSLTAFDLDVLNQWEKNSIDPNFICRVMCDISTEYQKSGKDFPKTLALIAYRIDKILVKMRNT